MKHYRRDFPDGPVVKSPCSQSWDPSSIFDLGIKILEVAQHGQTNKHRRRFQQGKSPVQSIVRLTNLLGIT